MTTTTKTTTKNEMLLWNERGIPCRGHANTYTRANAKQKMNRSNNKNNKTPARRIRIAFIDSGKCGIRSARLNL